MIVNEAEDVKTSQLYIKESIRLRSNQPNQKNVKDQDDEELDGEVEDNILEDEFIRLQKGGKKDPRIVEKILKKAQQQNDDDDLDGDDAGDDDDED